MEEELARDYGGQLPSRLKLALCDTGYPSLAAVKAAFEKDYDRASRDFLRTPNAGRVTLHQLLTLVEVPIPVYKPNLQWEGTYVSIDTPQGLSKADCVLLKKLIRGYLVVDPDSSMAQGLRSIKAKL
jgi:hypothetical protein